MTSSAADERLLAVELTEVVARERPPTPMGVAAPAIARARSRSIGKWLNVALAAIIAVQIGILAYHLRVTLAFPYDLNYGEGYVLFDAIRLAHGQPIYVDLQQFPMVRSPYPPLFPLIWSALVPLAGPALWPGRAIEVLGLFALAGIVGWNAWRACRSIWPVVAAIGLLAASPFVYQWAGYARVDLLALAFAAGGVAAAQWVQGRRGLLLAALLCGLALWTKQTTITATVAIAIALVMRSRREGLEFVALVALPTAAIAAVLNAITGGEFVRHVILGNASNPVLPLRAAIYIAIFILLHLIAVAGGLWWLRRALGGRPSPVAIYLVVALFASYSAGNGGSSVNYLIEPLVALALAVPFVWRAIQQTSPYAAPTFAILQLVLLFHWPNGFGTTYLGENAVGHTPTAGDWEIGAHLDDVVRSAQGEVIAEPAAFALRNGQQVYLQPIDLRAEELHGRWQSGPLVEALASGRFSTVITAYNLFPSDAERAIEQHFTLSETLPSPDGVTFRVYRFRH